MSSKGHHKLTPIMSFDKTCDQKEKENLPYTAVITANLSGQLDHFDFASVISRPAVLQSQVFSVSCTIPKETSFFLVVTKAGSHCLVKKKQKKKPRTSQRGNAGSDCTPSSRLRDQCKWCSSQLPWESSWWQDGSILPRKSEFHFLRPTTSSKT